MTEYVTVTRSTCNNLHGLQVLHFGPRTNKTHLGEGHQSPRKKTATCGRVRRSLAKHRQASALARAGGATNDVDRNIPDSFLATVAAFVGISVLFTRIEGPKILIASSCISPTVPW
jgi:hypothetical protein